MESVVGRLLTDQHMTLALAESCTGGLIGHRLTQMPDRHPTWIGALWLQQSREGGVVGASQDLLDRHGAVSAEVAAAMARGIRERSGVSVGLSVTGICRTGGHEDETGGTCLCGASTGTGRAMTKEFRFHGATAASSSNARRRPRWIFSVAG